MFLDRLGTSSEKLLEANENALKGFLALRVVLETRRNQKQVECRREVLDDKLKCGGNVPLLLQQQDRFRFLDSPNVAPHSTNLLGGSPCSVEVPLTNTPGAGQFLQRFRRGRKS